MTEQQIALPSTVRADGTPLIERRRGTPSTGLDRGRSSGLDGLRFAASVAVLLFHVSTLSEFSFGPLDPFVRGGDTGIWMFFALSGFLLYKPFLIGHVDLKGYGLKRAARIFPGYYLAFAALVLLTGSRLALEHPVAYLSTTFTYDIPLRAFFGNAWTLSAELLFYLTVPLLAWAARGRETAVLGGLAIASIALSVGHRLTMTGATEWMHGSYPLVFSAFVPGMLLAVLQVRRPEVLRRLARWPYLVLGLACLVLGTVMTISPIPIATMLGTPLVMGWLLDRRLPGARFLAFAGGASYALYLWHRDLFIAFGPLGLLIAVVGAALSWTLVERPILARAHALSAHWKHRTELERAIPEPAG